MDAVPPSWIVAEAGRWESADGRFRIIRLAEEDWRLTEIVRIGRVPAGVLMAALEFDRVFTSPRQAVCYAMRLARQLARVNGRNDATIGRGRPRSE